MKLQIKFVKIFAFTSLMFFGVILQVHGQDQTEHKPYLVESSTDPACELNNYYLNQLISKKGEQSNEQIFIISRLGKGERASIGWKRLMTAYNVLTIGKKIASDQILIAAGTRTKKNKGRIEFYLEGKLFLTSTAEKGKNVCLSCCPDK